MDLSWLIGIGVLLLVLLLAALAIDSVRRRQDAKPFPYPDTTTHLLSDTAIQKLEALPAARPTAKSTPLPRKIPRLRTPSLRRANPVAPAWRRLRTSSSARILLITLAASGALMSLGLLALVARSEPASPPPGGIVVGVSPFVGAPPKSEPTDRLVPDILSAAASGGLPGLVTRTSKIRVSGDEQAQAERARLKADFLIYGDVGPSGDLTVSLALAPSFSFGDGGWQRWMPADPTLLTLPRSAHVTLPAATGTSPIVPLAIALAQAAAGDFQAAAHAAHGASATIEQAGSTAPIGSLVEAATLAATGDYSDSLASNVNTEARGGQTSEGRTNRAYARLQVADYAGALSDAGVVLNDREATERTLAVAHLLRGRALIRLNGDYTSAVSEFEETLRLDPTLVQARLDKAEALYRQSQPDSARAEIQGLLKAAPDAAPAYRLLALVGLMLGKPDDALQALDRAQALYNGWVGIQRTDEARAQAMGDQESAHVATDNIVALNRELASVYLYRGMALADQARKQPPESFLGGIWRRIRNEPTTYERAIFALSDAVRLDPRRADILMQMGAVYAAMGDSSKAADAMQRARALDPTAPEPAITLAHLQESQGNAREAAATLTALLDKNPRAYSAYDQLYRIYKGLKDEPSANTTLERALNVPAQSAADHLWHSKFLRTLGRDGDAIAELQAATTDPALWEAHSLLGHLLLDNDHKPEALAQFQAVLAVQSNEPDALLNAGRLLVLAGQADQAQELLARLSDTSPDNVDGHIAYAQLLTGKGDLDKATSEAQHAVSADPKRADAYFALGQAREAQENWAQAAEQYKAATARDQTYFDAFIRLAIALCHDDRYAESIEAADMAIKLRPDDPQTHWWKAEAQLALRSPDDALASLGEALRLQPQFPEALALTGRAYALKGDYTSAVSYANQAISADTHNLVGYLALGDAYLAASRPVDALQAYMMPSSFAQDSPALLVGQGRARAATGNKDDAIKLFAQAASLDKQDAEPHFYAGRTHVEQGMWDAAFGEFSAALRLRPHWPEALYYLGNVYLQRKDLASAQSAFENATKYSPGLVEAWFALGMARRDLGRRPEAIAAFTKATHLYPGYANAWLYLGLTLEESGDRAGAANAFTSALSSTNDPALRKQADEGLGRVR